MKELFHFYVICDESKIQKTMLFPRKHFLLRNRNKLFPV